MVGVSGVGVNTFFLWFFTTIGKLHYMASSPLAVEIAVISNFLFNNFWTFRGTNSRASFFTRALRFHITSAAGFVINYTFLVGLTELTGTYYLLSNLAGILAAFLWNYLVNVKWTWAEPPA